MDLEDKYAAYADLFSDDFAYEDRQRARANRRARRERREAAQKPKEQADVQSV